MNTQFKFFRIVALVTTILILMDAYSFDYYRPTYYAFYLTSGIMCAIFWVISIVGMVFYYNDFVSSRCDAYEKQIKELMKQIKEINND